VYSTLWYVTAFDESNHPIAGDSSYAICYAALNCPSNVGTVSWNLANVYSALWHVTAASNGAIATIPHRRAFTAPRIIRD
jgi:hypothetical protein